MTTTLITALDAIPAEQVPAAIARLAARAMQQALQGDVATPDETLTVEQAAKLLHVTRRFVWNHARELGATRVSERKIVLSRRRLTRWLEARR